MFAVIETTLQSMCAFQNTDAAFHPRMPLASIDKPLAAFKRFALFGFIPGFGQDDSLDVHLLSKRFIVRRIHAAVRAGLSVPEEELPPLVAAVRRHDDPPQVAILGQLLAIFVKTIAFELQVDASLLAATSDLQEVVRWHLGSDDDGPPQVLTGWRGEILEPVLVELLEGKRSVRVRDVTSPSPICIDVCN